MRRVATGERWASLDCREETHDLEEGAGGSPTGEEMGGDWKADQMKEHQGRQGKLGLGMAWQTLRQHVMCTRTPQEWAGQREERK